MGTEPGAGRGPDPGRWPRLRPARLVLAIATAALGWACTEDPLTGPGPEEGERGAAETVELGLGPADMVTWRDTTFTGFAVPSDADFVVLADGADFRARALLRYRGIPDSVTVDSDTLEVEAFRDGRIRFLVDTARAALPSGGMTLRVLTLDRRYEAAEATWEQAADGRPWETPGGDFDQEVGRLELSDVDAEALADTLSVPLGSVTDSLLKAWRASGGQPGVGALLEAEGGRLPATEAFLEFDAKPAGRDTTVALRSRAVSARRPSAFIFDPPTPAPGRRLRVGGFPASRFYLTFRPPTEVDGARLPGSTINRAELVFAPAPPPSSPFALTGSVTAAGVRLPADPFAFGPRTPIGNTLSNGTTTLDPDSLSAGRRLRFEYTDVLRRWASNPDSAGELGVAVRLQPDAQNVGFWEFGHEGSDPALRPLLRVVVTPPSDFDVP